MNIYVYGFHTLKQDIWFNVQAKMVIEIFIIKKVNANFVNNIKKADDTVV